MGSRQTGSSWWTAMGFGAAPEPSAPDDDFADMGTAFGLDASLRDSVADAAADKREGPVSGAFAVLPPSSGERSRR